MGDTPPDCGLDEPVECEEEPTICEILHAIRDALLPYGQFVSYLESTLKAILVHEDIMDSDDLTQFLRFFGDDEILQSVSCSATIRKPLLQIIIRQMLQTSAITRENLEDITQIIENLEAEDRLSELYRMHVLKLIPSMELVLPKT